MTEQVFVARERELAQLRTFLDRALAGHGQVCFVTGEAGAGKTALVTEFARRAQEGHDDLLVAIGNCNAQTGIGDPYLPFREVLGMLTGDVQTKLGQGAITQENASRLRAFLRVSGQALVDLGPDLIDVFVPGAGVATRAGALLAGKALSRGEARGISWLERLEGLVERKAASVGGRGLEQQRIFEQYADVLRALAAQQPLLLMLDDLQWADASSISLLFHLGRRIGDSRILILNSYRPEDVALGRSGERHPLEPVLNEFKRYHGDIWVDLSLTEEAKGRRFVEALIDAEPNRLSEDFRQALFQHTGGHPLFTVELLRALQERGDPSTGAVPSSSKGSGQALVRDEEGWWEEGPALDWGTLPARVEGVIEERIGRLEEELRETLTVASVEGEEFTAEVVARVQAVDERRLVRRLSGELDKQHRLARAGGIRRVNSQRLSLYYFRHNLFQGYLYNSLDEVERAYLHEDVGNVLEELYGDQAETIAVQLARHFQEAGIAERAIHYLHQAGERAVRSSANEEAIAHFNRALALLETQPDTPERAEQELALQLALGASLMATRGFGAPEVGRAYHRAMRLCQQMGETPQLFWTIQSLASFYSGRADYETALELAEQNLSIAERAQDPVKMMFARWAVGYQHLYMGKFAQALDHLEQVNRVYDLEEHRSLIFRFGMDPGTYCLTWAGHALWYLGYPDQALKRSQGALALAEELDHPLNRVFALCLAGVDFNVIRRELQAARNYSEPLVQLAAQEEAAFFHAVATVFHGWLQTEAGRAEEGIAEMRRGLAAFQATGAELERPHFLTMLAEAYVKTGQAEEGLKLLSEALAQMEKSGERFYEAEVYRIRGELLLMQGDETEAEASFHQAESCFQHAIKIARRQQAKSWELRATVSLCRLLESQGKGEEARQVLAEIYDWFTEGFDTPDLKEAKALLEALNH